jgi:ribonuclease Z
LILAKDMMVFNVSKREILTRMAVTSSDVWPNKENREGFKNAARKERMQMSRWLADKQLFPKF